MECEYCDKFKELNFGDYILDTKYWVILLAPNQSNLGTCVIPLKRHYGNLSGLKEEEWLDLINIIKRLEFALKKAFNATMFNWGCLLNNFYRKENPDPHVHWHFIPRYDHKIEFDGLIFEDPHFGYMRPRASKNISNDVRIGIIQKIIENFK
jgi:ATP adenylyltransferase